MIVRISGEDQYRLPDADAQHVSELESALVAAVDACDEGAFASSSLPAASAWRAWVSSLTT